MKHGKLTREEAVTLAGEEAVSKVEKINCEPTSRLQCDGDPDTEWAASIQIKDPEGYYEGDNARTLTAYYYTTPEDMKMLEEADGDGSAINWEIHGYEIF